MIKVFALGDAVIEAETVRFTPSTAKKFGLLLFLAAEGKTTSRAVLNDLLFPGLEEKKAQHGLRELVYQLRQIGVEISGDCHGLTVNPASVACDWVRVTHASPPTADMIRAAQGGFLPGYAPSLSESFSEWLDALRARASLDVVKALLREVDRAKTAGNWRLAEDTARACLALDRLNGHATIALAEMLAIGGSATKASELLDDYAAELGPEARKFAVPVQALRRRIADGFGDTYSHTTFAFVGRDEEMTLLARGLAEAKHDGPRAVFFVGDPGVGKSRIATEFALKAKVEGCAVVRANAHPYDKTRPMSMFIDMVPQLLKQTGALGCAPGSMEWLNHLVGRAIKPEQATLSHEATSNAITRAIVDVIGAVVGETPLVLVIDDVQWVDNVSLELLRDLGLAAELTGLFLILVGREERPIFTAGNWPRGLTCCRVGPLDRATSARLVRQELSSLSEGDPSLTDWMVDVANGNPFYADCAITYYRNTGERFVVPPQLSSIVDQRIHALTPEARDVLETIVALGKHATVDRIERVLGTYGATLIRHTRELGAARLITDEQPVTASHWLISESVRRNAVPLSQRLLYRRIATALESELRTDGDSSELWECAEAWVVAEEPDHAANMIATCADHALTIGRAREASDLYFRASRLATDGQSTRLAEASVRAAVSSSDPRNVVRAIAVLPRENRPRVHDDIELAELRTKVWRDSDLEQTVADLRECFELPENSREHRLTAARAYLSACEHGQLIEQALAAHSSIAGLLQEASSDAHWTQCAAMFHSFIGDQALVPDIVAEIVETADHARPDEASNLLKVAAACLRRIGQRSEALALWARAYAIAKRSNLEWPAAGLCLTLASQHLDAGQFSLAQEWLAQVEPPTDCDADRLREYAYWSVAGDFAFFEHDSARLLTICENIERLPTDNVGVRVRRWRRSFLALLTHLRGQSQDPIDLVADLTQDQIAGYETGDCGDSEMAILLTILREAGERSLARDEFGRYINKRQTRLPLSASLLQAKARLDEA